MPTKKYKEHRKDQRVELRCNRRRKKKDNSILGEKFLEFLRFSALAIRWNSVIVIEKRTRVI